MGAELVEFWKLDATCISKGGKTRVSYQPRVGGD